MRRIKKILLFLFVMLLLGTAYVLYVNRNSKDMTLRQKLLKAVYPLFVWSKKKTAETFSNGKATPAVSFYSLQSVLNNGTVFPFEQLKGKKVLLVNTASNCGYTGQYDELQKLYEQYADKLVILGFPANDFKEQEKGTDEDIAQFCKINFGVTFPLMKKSTVVKAADQNDVYKWLSDSTKNGWNNKAPSWNFSKYLISEDGKLLNYFDPAVSPLGKEIVDQLQ